MKYSDSICGAYANIDDFKDGLIHKIEWVCNIPFDDLLVLQAFDLFPNFAIPNVELRCYVSEDGFVYCPLDPHYVYDVKTLIQEEEIVHTLPSIVKYTHQFTQINNSCIMPIKCSYIDAVEADLTANPPIEATPAHIEIESGETTLICMGLTVSDFSSHMCGFGVCEASMKDIINILQE